MRSLVAVLLAAPARAFVAPARSLAPVRQSAPPPLHASPVDLAQLPTQLVAELENAVPIDKSGWFGGIVQAMESVITFLHDVVGSYGIAIVLFTLILKVATFPLNKAQIESTTKMQALQPAIKKIQATYAADPDKMNMMMAQLYQENELNPLAGCLPCRSLAGCGLCCTGLLTEGTHVAQLRRPPLGPGRRRRRRRGGGRGFDRPLRQRAAVAVRLGARSEQVDRGCGGGWGALGSGCAHGSPGVDPAQSRPP